MSKKREPSVVGDWCHRVVHGTCGFESYEQHELPVWSTSREQAIAEFVIRSLANPKCNGSAVVLKAIIERRREQDSVAWCDAKFNGQGDE